MNSEQEELDAAISNSKADSLIADALVQNMNRGAGQLFDSVYKLFAIHTLYVQI